jgi:hypothetical protein
MKVLLPQGNGKADIASEKYTLEHENPNFAENDMDTRAQGGSNGQLL